MTHFVGGAWETNLVSEDMQRATKPLARLARDTTPDNPWPLRLLSTNIRAYVDKMSEMWVEGQVVQYTHRGSTRMAFFTLRDVDEDVSMNVTAFGHVVSAPEGFDEGARIVARVKPTFWEQRGTLSLRASEIRLQGLGSLLAQIERLRKTLAAEGLFSPERKKPLPFLPRRIGLVCGKKAKAMDDVIVNARLRWPSCMFEVREVAVQGQYAVTQVTAAIAELDVIPDVDVIVVARGGGSVEELLPFSSEEIVRAAAACSTPLVSAIGHEGDAPLLDFVADYRASTPTDAARRIVPDFREELRELAASRMKLHASVRRYLALEFENLTLLTARPVLQRPTAAIEQQRAGLEQAALRISAAAERAISQQRADIDRLTAVLKTLSPLNTLARGYSIIRLSDKTVVRSADQLKGGTLIEGMLSQGTFVGQVVGANPKGSFLQLPEPTSTTPAAETPTADSPDAIDPNEINPREEVHP